LAALRLSSKRQDDDIGIGFFAVEVPAIRIAEDSYGNVLPKLVDIAGFFVWFVTDNMVRRHGCLLAVFQASISASGNRSTMANRVERGISRRPDRRVSRHGSVSGLVQSARGHAPGLLEELERSRFQERLARQPRTPIPMRPPCRASLSANEATVTGLPDRVPPGARLAYLQLAEGGIPEQADLVFERK
jgi:hypothetical protein